MNKDFFLQGNEDEMEFMPIIPLNDEEDANADAQPIPDELPILPLRNTVLFPGVVIPITVGRDKSIKAFCTILEFTEAAHMINPVFKLFDMTIEHGGIGRKSQFMGFLMNR